MTCTSCDGLITDEDFGTEQISVCSSCGRTYDTINCHVLTTDSSTCASNEVQNYHRALVNPKRSTLFKQAFIQLNVICEKLFIPQIIKTNCIDLLKRVLVHNSYKKLLRVNIIGACVIICARNEVKPELRYGTVAELLGHDSSVAKIGRIAKNITKDFAINMSSSSKGLHVINEALNRVVDENTECSKRQLLKTAEKLFTLIDSLTTIPSHTFYAYICVYLSLKHHLGINAPKINDISRYSDLKQKTLERHKNNIVNELLAFTDGTPIYVTPKNVTVKLGEILHYQESLLKLTRYKQSSESVQITTTTTTTSTTSTTTTTTNNNNNNSSSISSSSSSSTSSSSSSSTSSSSSSSTSSSSCKLLLSDDGLSDIDDEEINGMIRSQSEVEYLQTLSPYMDM